MRRIERLVCACIVLGLTAGCSSLRTWTDYSETADFLAKKTFQFKDGDGSLAGSQQLVHDRIIAAIGRQMKAKGFREADSNPDLYVSYYTSVNTQLSVNMSHHGYIWGPSWHWGRPGFATTTSVTTYDRGTLVIDMWEASEKQLIWRGTADDVLSANPDRNATKIDRAVSVVFRSFPPSSGS